jgi:hypothetical protein
MHLRHALNLLHFLPYLVALYALCLASKFYEIHHRTGATNSWLCKLTQKKLSRIVEFSESQTKVFWELCLKTGANPITLLHLMTN